MISNPRIIPVIEILESRVVLSGTPPLAQADFAATWLDVPIKISVLANDSGSGPLNVVSLSGGNNGMAVLNPDNTVTYTPGLVGWDYFTYTISDGTDQAIGTVSISVSPGAYETYLSAVQQADQVYQSAVQMAGYNRQTTVDQLREATATAAAQLQTDYDAAVASAFNTYQEAEAAARIEFEAASSSFLAIRDQGYAQAMTDYYLDNFNASQEYNEAVVNAEQAFSHALATASYEYFQALAPLQETRDLAYQYYLANPDDPQALAVYNDAELALQGAILTAGAQLNAAEISAQTLRDVVLQTALQTFTNAWVQAVETYQVNLSAVDLAYFNGLEGPKAIYQAAQNTAWNTFTAAEAANYTGFSNSLESLMGALAISESNAQFQLDANVATAQVNWQAQEQAGWNNYLLALAVNPDIIPQMRILAPGSVALPPLTEFERVQIRQDRNQVIFRLQARLNQNRIECEKLEQDIIAMTNARDRARAQYQSAIMQLLSQSPTTLPLVYFQILNALIEAENYNFFNARLKESEGIHADLIRESIQIRQLLESLTTGIG